MATIDLVVLIVACALTALVALTVLAALLLPSGWRPRRSHRGA